MATADLLEQLRPPAFAVAYRMLGSVSEAEDEVQQGLPRPHRTLEAGEPSSRRGRTSRLSGSPRERASRSSIPRRSRWTTSERAARSHAHTCFGPGRSRRQRTPAKRTWCSSNSTARSCRSGLSHLPHCDSDDARPAPIWCTGTTPARASSRFALGDRRMARCARCRWWRSGDDFATRVGSRAHEHRHVLRQASILRARPRAARG